MFCDKLKAYRKQKGITQEELAKAIFVSRSLIAKYETGVTYPNKENLEKLALFFEVKISDLIENSEITLEVANSKNIASKLNYICLMACSICSALISICVFIPFFQGSRYSYPVEVGEIPKLEDFQASIFSGTYNYGNYIGLILFFVSFASCLISVVSLILKGKRYSPFLNLASYLAFFVDIILFFVSIVVCFSYIS